MGEGIIPVCIDNFLHERGRSKRWELSQYLWSAQPLHDATGVVGIYLFKNSLFQSKAVQRPMVSEKMPIVEMLILGLENAEGVQYISASLPMSVP